MRDILWPARPLPPPRPYFSILSPPLHMCSTHIIWTFAVHEIVTEMRSPVTGAPAQTDLPCHQSGIHMTWSPPSCLDNTTSLTHVPTVCGRRHDAVSKKDVSFRVDGALDGVLNALRWLSNTPPPHIQEWARLAAIAKWMGACRWLITQDCTNSSHEVLAAFRRHSR
jgi:hypothetical protein